MYDIINFLPIFDFLPFNIFSYHSSDPSHLNDTANSVFSFFLEFLSLNFFLMVSKDIQFILLHLLLECFTNLKGYQKLIMFHYYICNNFLSRTPLKENLQTFGPKICRKSIGNLPILHIFLRITLKILFYGKVKPTECLEFFINFLKRIEIFFR